MFSNRFTRIVALIGMSASLSAAYGQGINVEVNGERVYFPNARPQMIGGRVLVPLRGVMEQIGAYVSWDPVTRTVRAQRSGTDLEMRIGDRVARVDGRPISLDVPAMILRGSTMVPLRFMSEALGADVSWMAHTQTVRITTDMDVRDPQPPIYPPTNPPVGAPFINSFRANAPGGILRTGDMIRLELFGTPSADVSYSIPGVFGTRRMREERPGVYVAEFTVPLEANGMRESDIVATLFLNGQQRTWRANSAPGAPTPPTDTRAPRIISMEPGNGEYVSRTRPTIEARIDDRDGSGIDTWRLYVDNEDVTDDAFLTNGLVRYVPTRSMSEGSHRVRLEVEDRLGNRSSASWMFYVNRGGSDPYRNTTFTHNASTRVRPGDVVTFTLTTEPDAQVTYSIGSVVRDRAMTEIRPGVYTSTYTIRRSDDFWNTPITARVRTRSGQVFTVDASTL